MRYCIIFLLLLCSCGYRYKEGDPLEGSGAISLMVPYISGDSEALFNNELAYSLSTSGQFHVVQSGGALLLKVEIVSDTHDRIGFRYDRDNPGAHLEKNLLGVEARRTLVVAISLLDGVSGRILFGPEKVKSYVDYDYTDPGSPRDLLFSKKEPIMPFSLGQLDSAEGAYDAAAKPIFRKISHKIVEGLLHKLPDIQKEYSS